MSECKGAFDTDLKSNKVCFCVSNNTYSSHGHSHIIQLILQYDIIYFFIWSLKSLNFEAVMIMKPMYHHIFHINECGF